MLWTSVMDTDPDRRPRRDWARGAAWGWLVALIAVVVSTCVRVDTALSDPNFAGAPLEGVLKSDPGLAYYVVERIVEAGGGVPDDFRADPRIEHPDLVDIPARMPVGLHFLVAWSHLAWNANGALLTTCLWVSAALASCVLLGIYGLARELAGRALPAVLAVVAAAALFANHRTIGNVLADEDLALPLFAAHLWLAARAVRVPGAASVALAALPLAAALASWHATGFFAALEAGAVLVWFGARGRCPLPWGRAWPLVLVLAAAGLAVPMLRETGLVFSFPMLVALGLWGASGIARLRGGNGEPSRMLGVGCVAALVATAALASRMADTGLQHHAHVVELLASKVRHLGVLPEDPAAVGFETRLMWQGPFATTGPWEAALQLGFLLLAPAAATWSLLRAGRGADPRVEVAVLFAWISLPAAWLVIRALVLPGMLLPALLAWWAAASRPRAVAAAIGVALQVAVFAAQVADHALSWYWPHERQIEIARVVQAVRRLVPDGEPVAADFMTSTAILAHTRHPIVFQPKWEARPSRERVRRLFETLYGGTTDDLRRLLLDEYRCRYLVVDRYTLWTLGRNLGGLPRSAREPAAGSAARSLLSWEDETLRSIPGYRLLYRSPGDLRQPNGAPTDFYRVYELGR